MVRPFRSVQRFICSASALLLTSLVPAVGLRSQQQETRIGLVQDWSHRHTVFTRIGPMREMMEVQRDPRSFLAWQSAAIAAHRNQAGENQPHDFVKERASHRRRHPRPIRKHGLRTDWSINLGTGGVAPAMSPAKFTFDVNAAPSCASDFVVFPVSQAPAVSRENIVAFNNLYSGAVPAPGVCNRVTSASDDGTAATVFWSYAINAIGGGVLTSPVLSLDGKKVAFVESLTASVPHFHVLAWKSGDGVNPANLQSPASPKVITAFSATAPAPGSGTATDLAFGTIGDTLSSPFIDYQRDKAYVGDNQGVLVRIKDVFCTVSPACFGVTPPAPSLDLTWGLAGSVIVGPGSCAGTATSRLTGPVVDGITGNVFVGCGNGRLYGFNSLGAPLATPSIAVGDGSESGGIVDPPIVDGINGLVYAFSSSTAGRSAVVVQAKNNLSSALTATVGGSAAFNLHAGAFNDAYFSSSVSGNWLLYVAAYDSSGSNPTLYGVTFNSSRAMTPGTPANALLLAISTGEYAPLTEILNGGTDWLFAGVLAGTPNLDSFRINTFPAVEANTAGEPGGTSGIIVDNVSTQNQASSIYFSTQAPEVCGVGGNGRCAVKLTQAGFQ